MAVILGFEAQLGASWEQIHRLLLEPMVTLRYATTLGMSASLWDSEDLAKSSKMYIEHSILSFFVLCCAACYPVFVSILSFPRALLGCSSLSTSSQNLFSYLYSACVRCGNGRKPLHFAVVVKFELWKLTALKVPSLYRISPFVRCGCGGIKEYFLSFSVMLLS